MATKRLTRTTPLHQMRCTREGDWVKRYSCPDCDREIEVTRTVTGDVREVLVEGDTDAQHTLYVYFRGRNNNHGR